MDVFSEYNMVIETAAVSWWHTALTALGDKTVRALKGIIVFVINSSENNSALSSGRAGGRL